MASDWTACANFWERFILHDMYFVSPLGNWVTPTHRLWEQQYLPNSDTIQQAVNRRRVEYYIVTRGGYTRGDTQEIHQFLHTFGWATTSGLPLFGGKWGYCHLSDIIQPWTGSEIKMGRPDLFIQCLREWGGEQMWLNVWNKVVGNGWILQHDRSSAHQWSWLANLLYKIRAQNVLALL